MDPGLTHIQTNTLTMAMAICSILPIWMQNNLPSIPRSEPFLRRESFFFCVMLTERRSNSIIIQFCIGGNFSISTDFMSKCILLAYSTARLFHSTQFDFSPNYSSFWLSVFKYSECFNIFRLTLSTWFVFFLAY